MVKLTADRQSAATLMKAAKAVKKASNETWNLAPKAPMFTRKTKNQQGKKKVVRTKRVIGTHAIKIAASGGAAYAAAVLGRESNMYRVSMADESKRCPWLPGVTKGAIAVIESFICAYAQEATRHAVTVRHGLGTMKDGKQVPLVKRLNGKVMKLGYDAADAAIFQSAMPAPRSIVVCKAPKKVKKGEDRKDADYNPPEAD